jgi:hypothetical protein
MTDLPANVTFRPNPDGRTLAQQDDAIKSVQAFRNGGEFIIELWGETTTVSPAGTREENREFQQNSWIDFDGKGGFTWRVTRWVYDASHTIDQATKFEAAGTKDSVPEYRRI